VTATLPEPQTTRSPSPRRGAAAARRYREARRRAVRVRLVRAPARRPATAALLAVAWMLGVGLAVCAALSVFGWAVGGYGASGFGAALRAGGLVFAAAHLAPVSLSAGTVSLLPLGLLALPLVLSYRAGRWAARLTACDSLRTAGSLVALAAVGYAAGVTVVASLSDLAGASVAVPLAFVHSLVVAALGVGAGVVRGAGLARPVRAALPPLLRAAAPAALASTAALVTAAGAVLAVAMALRLPEVAAMAREVAGGAADGLALLLLGLLYLPTFLVWAMAYVTGSGVVLGSAAVTPFDAGGGLAPSFPALAALPQAPPPYAAALLLLPVAAGAVGGAVLTRRAARRGAGGVVLLPEVALASLLTGVLATALGWAASGSVGDGRLAHVGPTAWLLGLSTTGLVLAGCTAWTVLAPLLGRSGRWIRTLRPARPTPAAVTELDAAPSRWARLRAHLYHDGIG
jgi:hypothetical protein